MAGYEVSVGRDLLPGLLGGQDGLAEAGGGGVEPDTGGAGGGDTGSGGVTSGQRAGGLSQRLSPARSTPALGRSRCWCRRRGRALSTEIFKRYQRSRQAFVLALMGNGRAGACRHGRSRRSPRNCAGRAFFRNRRSARCVRAGRTRAGVQRAAAGRRHLPFVLVDALFVKAGKATASFHAPRWWYRASAAAAIARFSA